MEKTTIYITVRNIGPAKWQRRKCPKEVPQELSVSRFVLLVYGSWRPSVSVDPPCATIIPASLAWHITNGNKRFGHENIDFKRLQQSFLERHCRFYLLVYQPALLRKERKKPTRSRDGGKTMEGIRRSNIEEIGQWMNSSNSSILNLPIPSIVLISKKLNHQRKLLVHLQRGEWPSGPANSISLTEVKHGCVRSETGWATSRWTTKTAHSSVLRKGR